MNRERDEGVRLSEDEQEELAVGLWEFLDDAAPLNIRLYRLAVENSVAPRVQRIVAARLAQVAAERDRWRSAELTAGRTADAAEDKHDALVEAVRALVSCDEAKKWRDEAARGSAVLPYASNRYVRLVDELRAVLPPAEEPA